jgi:dipeptidyl-peptidase-4
VQGPLAQTSPTAKQPLTIEAIFAPGGLTGRAPEAVKWSPDSTKVAFIQRDNTGEHGELWYADAATGEKKLLVNTTKLASLAPSLEKIKDDREKERLTHYHIDPYQWAPSSQHLLFNSQGQLWLYIVESGAAVQITSSDGEHSDPKFSSDGKKLAYLRGHNLYVRDIPNGIERALTQERPAKEGSENNILNGEVDWVYAEELSVRSNYFWSPNREDIVYLQMDETEVPSYPIVNWIPTHPKVDMEKYPKAGDPNPVVRLGVVSASGGKTKWISLGNDRDIYIPRFGWIRDGLIWAEVLNRAQNNMDLYFADAHSGRSRKVLTETTPGAWVNVNDDFQILKSRDRFLWSSWRDGTTQIYLYSFDKADPLASEAKLQRQLTKGDFEVLAVEGVDEDAGIVYVSCNKDDPRQEQLYSVRVDGSDFRRISKEEGTHKPTFADDGKHYIDQFSSLTTPPRLSVCMNGACQSVWNSAGADQFDLSPPKFLEFKADDGTVLCGELVTPPDFTNKAKVPLIVNIYGGPAAQLVTNSWIEDWAGSDGLFHQLLSQKGFAIFTVDNRGTPNRDRKFMTAVRHQYGGVELKDQLTALDQVLAQYPQLDRDRLAIWGWSNGGSMTLYAMTHSDRFKAGVSVAPVTDWHNYDSIYTERNNGLPTDKDTTSYVDMDLPKVASKLHGSLFLAHGTSDDNVHFQNSIQMIDALIQVGKPFRFMAYPNKTHSISGSADRIHLFHTIEDHFERELK